MWPLTTIAFGGLVTGLFKSSTTQALFRALLGGLRELGYVEGRDM